VARLAVGCSLAPMRSRVRQRDGWQHGERRMPKFGAAAVAQEIGPTN